MKKSLVFVASGLFASAIFATPTVSDVIVRQQWPWRSQVRVDFLLNGMGSSDVKFSFTAYDGETSLGAIPDAAIVGDKYADQNGLKTVTIDPAYAPALQALGDTEAFRLEVSCTEIGQLLYKVIDLTKTRGEADHIRYITAADLKTGHWGNYQENPVSGVTSVIWVAPAAGDNDYKKKFLVLRRIRPGSFVFGAEKSPVTLTKGYWMGIFETTGYQYSRFATPRVTSGDCYPQRNVAQVDLRGSEYSWPGDGHKVTTDSWFGKLCAQVGEGGFDLSTEAQWENACRAGTTDNAIYRSDKTLTEAAVYNVSSASSVGSKSPNAWGLFDMIGNVWEHTLVWYSLGVDPGNHYDPLGPTAKPASGNREVRGGCYASGVGNCSCVSRTADTNTTPDGFGGYYGFRIVQNDIW